MNKEKVIIIGGGLSGVMVALSLCEMNDGPEIILLEKDPQKLGRGVAYQHEFTHQPLNVVAGGMSLYANRPDDFVVWLKRNAFRYKHLVSDISENSFIPRKIFGDYVVECLKETHDRTEGRFQIRIDEAISILGSGTNRTVVLSSGVTLQGNHVVLALGNFPPADILADDQSLKNDSRYFSNPWTDKVYENINGNENILLIGTGLSAVDVVLGLQVRNFEGKVIMLSRRGKLPLPHFISDKKYNWEGDVVLSPEKLFSKIRATIKSNPEVPWPLIIDSLRGDIQSIWKSWSLDEKKVFMKRFRPFWEVARHRIPQYSSQILEKLIAQKKLEVGKGNILSVSLKEEGIETNYQKGNEVCKTVFQKIINCTGPESNYRNVKFPIIQDLMERGKVVPDALGLGILCQPDGGILNRENEKETGLWCIGPMRKAVLWETTALREIRVQSNQLAQELAKRGQ